MVPSLLLAGSLFGLSQAVSLPLTTRNTNSTKAFSWVDTKPTRDLQYYDCGNGFQCARLEVPLDWSNPTENSTASIGIVKVPATVPNDDPSFAGSILINPGGPSGSGTGFAYSFGPILQKVLGQDRNYEIIGFDPRGVNTSTPRADCFKGDQFARRLSQERDSILPPINAALGYHWADANAQSALCEENGVDSIWGHMNTASVARDMVEIIDRIDDLRWKESGKAKPKNAEAARLQYVGISYGTYLGNTFASMFPERIGRIWIDAVVDGDDWSAGVSISHLLEICPNVNRPHRPSETTSTTWRRLLTNFTLFVLNPRKTAPFSSHPTSPAQMSKPVSPAFLTRWIPIQSPSPTTAAQLFSHRQSSARQFSLPCTLPWSHSNHLLWVSAPF